MKMRLRNRVGGDGRRRAGTEMLPRISDVSDRPGMLNYRVRVDDKETEDRGREPALADDTGLSQGACEERQPHEEWSRATEKDVVSDTLLVWAHFHNIE